MTRCPECDRPWPLCQEANSKVAEIYRCGYGPLPEGKPALPGAARRNPDSNGLQTKWREVWVSIGKTPETPDPNGRDTEQ